MGVQHYKAPRRTILLRTKKVLRCTDVPASAYERAAAAHGCVCCCAQMSCCGAWMYLLLRTNELLRRMQAKKKGILTPETAHDARHCPENPNLDKDSHPPAEARGRRLSDAMTLGIEVGNSQSKKMTMKTPVASAVACARKTPYSGGRKFGYNKWPINSTTTKAGVTPASGTSENPGAVYTAAEYLETEEQ